MHLDPLTIHLVAMSDKTTLEARFIFSVRRKQIGPYSICRKICSSIESVLPSIIPLMVILWLMISSFFVTALSAEDDTQNCSSAPDSLWVKELSHSQWEIAWIGSDEDIYHIYASDKWQDLMPEDSAKTFYESPHSQPYVLFSTSKKTIQIAEYRYLRIIRQHQDFFSDISSLLQVDPRNKDLIEQSPTEAEKQLQDGTDVNFVASDYPSIPSEIWKKVCPYFLPRNHKMRAVMDKIFSHGSVLSSIKKFQKAGFEIVIYREGRQMILARHPDLKGYLVKVYLDIHTRTDWTAWILRARGSAFVRDTLKKLKMTHYFKAPKKWIYPVHRSASYNPQAPYTKHFVLLVQDMQLQPRQKLEHKFKNEMTKPYLLALFTALKKTGYNDSHIENIPLSIDGRLAFIDLEHFNQHPVQFHLLSKHIAPDMLEYWEKLIKKYEQERLQKNAAALVQ